ncbi:unnamed protein product [Blepharisma stoltei]|uniref:PHD-type domain-containing protein n=1 Tax=Blepharisma stoltei TaxID=1481888 RepID=A0AAU9IM39_9CILI|nr:unnamed protein product [Blepharisma stoltei]
MIENVTHIQNMAEVKNDDTCKICGKRGDLICCDRCPSSYHFNCLGIQRDVDEETWFCPPCQKEIKLRDKAKAENWTKEKLNEALHVLKEQKEQFALPKREYIDPVPQLRQITDFMNPSSEEEEEDPESGSITRIGTQFQSSLPAFGEISIPSSKCQKIWDCHRLSVTAVDDYLRQAGQLWERSYLKSLIPFNEQDACKILHIKNYNIQNALQAIVHERLPYIVLTESDKDKKVQDLAALRNGEPLSL